MSAELPLSTVELESRSTRGSLMHGFVMAPWALASSAVQANGIDHCCKDYFLGRRPVLVFGTRIHHSLTQGFEAKQLYDQNLVRVQRSVRLRRVLIASGFS